jgi:hypothetical protein
VDVWPTLFEYLGTSPRPAPSSYSDGRSLLEPPSSPTHAYVAGRFFPYADRPSVLVDSASKYWFRVSGVGPSDRLCVVVTRVTDLEDRPLPVNPSRLDTRSIPAFVLLQSTFWRFIRHEGVGGRPANCTMLSR